MSNYIPMNKDVCIWESELEREIETEGIRKEETKRERKKNGEDENWEERKKDRKWKGKRDGGEHFLCEAVVKFIIRIIW